MIGYDVEILAVEEGHFVKHIELEEHIRTNLSELVARASDEEEESRLLQMTDEGVAVIEIKGGLTNKNRYWNRWYGLVSYDEIRTAIVQGVEKGATHMVFDIDSPGGNVSGLSDIANFMSSLDVKTYAFTSGMMASAAYFFGSQADYVYADSFSEVGSIGVILKTYDRSKYLADLGVKPMRFRSGDLKAVGDQDFKMSKQEQSYLQAKVDNFAGKFYDIVSDARGIPVPVLEKTGVTSGQTFIGEEAKDVGLVDKIMSFDEVMLKAFNSAKKVDKQFGNRLSLH